MSIQRTIADKTGLEGLGIHTGREIKVVFKPAPENSGINFIRIDLPGSPVISASLANLAENSQSLRRTSLRAQDAEIHTIEHLMAALYGLEIDNIEVEINGPELPGLDGSAEGFVQILKKAGICEQQVPRRCLQIIEPISVSERDSLLMIIPDVNLRISYTLDYPTTNIKTQYNQFLINPEMFAREIAPSRTFCLREEVDRLRSLGLGKGASLENTLVLGEEGLISGTVRFKDEFLRHKVLDLVGDLYLTGIPVIGHVIGVKSGHALNIRLLQKIWSQVSGLQKQRAGDDKLQRVTKGILYREDIEKIIPHRYPFVMIDRIIEMGHDRAVGIKFLSNNDYFFAGHFPKLPVMPGVLILEAMAQVGGVLMLSREGNHGKIAYFMSINNAKFRQVVKPGDELRLEVQVTRFKTRTGQIHSNAYVGDKLAAEADLMFVLSES